MKKRRRAAFELSREHFQGIETEFVRMYVEVPLEGGDEEATVVGQTAYAIDEKNEFNLQVITVNDWSEETAVVERMLKFLEGVAKRKKVKLMKCELYMSDAKTVDKIEKMKACGWDTLEVGRTGQRSSYTLVRRLG
jgi:hypothetical protein